MQTVDFEMKHHQVDSGHAVYISKKGNMLTEGLDRRNFSEEDGLYEPEEG